MKYLIGFALVTSLVGVASAASMTEVDVEDGGTGELVYDSDANSKPSYNNNGTSFVMGQGSTLRLVGAEDGGGADFIMRAATYCADADGFTIDGTGLVGYSDTLQLNGCCYCPNGPVKVKGFKKVVFTGTDKYNNTTATVSLNAKDVVFDPTDAANELVFSNMVTMAAVPETCRWSVAPGALFWACPSQCLADAEHDAFSPQGWDLGLINSACVSNDVIEVPANGHLPFRHCKLNWAKTRMGNWSPEGDTYIRKDVVLGEGATLEFYNNKDGTTCGVIGDVSGAGSVIRTRQSGESRVTTVLNGAADYTGTTTLNGTKAGNEDAFVFTDPTPATSCLVFSGAGCQGVFRFRPTGYGTEATEVAVNAVQGSSDANHVIGVEAYQTLTVGTVSGTVQFNGPATAKVIIGSLSADAKIRLVGGVKLQVNAIGAGAQVVLGGADDTASGVWHIEGPATGDSIYIPVTEVVPGGTIYYGGNIQPWLSWQEKVALWTDATADSFMFVREANPEATAVGETGIFWWYDRRPEQRDFAWAMPRFPTNDTANVNRYPNMYPTVISNGLNGLSYVKASHSNQSRMGAIKPGTTLNNQTKSLHLNIPSRYAIVVANNGNTSQGSAILSSSDGRLAASKRGYGGNIFTNELITAYKNGTEINPRETTWGNAIWGIYSFTTAEAKINGLCAADNPADSGQGGGFNYAEILIFSEMPTEAERKIAEEYLSEKWGIDVSHGGTTDVRTLSLDVPATPPTAPVLTLGGKHSLPLVLNIDFAGKPAAGSYPLVAGDLAEDCTLGTVTGQANRQVSLRYDETAKIWYADVMPPGLILFLK